MQQAEQQALKVCQQKGGARGEWAVAGTLIGQGRSLFVANLPYARLEIELVGRFDFQELVFLLNSPLVSPHGSLASIGHWAISCAHAPCDLTYDGSQGTLCAARRPFRICLRTPLDGSKVVHCFVGVLHGIE